MIKHKVLLLMFLPGFLLFFLFQYVPMYGLLIAFKDFKILDGIWNSPWAGLDHFRRLFAGDDFARVLRNTIYIALLKVVLVFPAPILLAVLLNEVRHRAFRRWVQTVSYLPYFFSWVILAGILFSLLSLEGGVNQLLAWFGIPRIGWWMSSDYFYGLIVASAIWQGAGWGSIVYFAALSSIDPTLYEAAIADGANRFKRIWHITLPSLMPTIITMFLLYIGHFLSVGFDQIYNLTTSINSNVADILDTYVLRRMLTMDYELGAAAGIFSSLVGLAMVVGSNRLIKKYDKDQGLW
ncbi:sugar ABC transporter permease [Paenibacillus contaminans]|uniref:Sugar ABC transporter permease n=2 Tax=Paenibacillus contaminans TaxID=450362 RepID=A0A329MIV8_9BACL|nr:sugar ABC transporter permease [Paenibacillus contaminans]